MDIYCIFILNNYNKMLVEESIWIGKKITEIAIQNSYPILNVGSSTKEYRTKKQGFIQKNIFDLIPDESRNVIHLDMKAAEGVDLVGNLYDPIFLEEIKKFKVKCILFNNVLMYLNRKQRIEICQILKNILEKDGYLIVTNSHVFPPAPDPVESYYRHSPKDLYVDLFNDFTIVDSTIVETNYSFDKQLKARPKLIPIKIARFLIQFYKFEEWKFMLNYNLNNYSSNYSSSCLLLQKK